jgi:hypothetical protein
VTIPTIETMRMTIHPHFNASAAVGILYLPPVVVCCIFT